MDPTDRVTESIQALFRLGGSRRIHQQQMAAAGVVPLPIAGPGGGPIRVEFSFQDNGLQTTEDELNAIDIEALEIDYEDGQEAVNELGDVP